MIYRAACREAQRNFAQRGRKNPANHGWAQIIKLVLPYFENNFCSTIGLFFQKLIYYFSKVYFSNTPMNNEDSVYFQLSLVLIPKKKHRGEQKIRLCSFSSFTLNNSKLFQEVF